MKTKVELGLQGAFKVDLYKGKEFVETTDWFSNFITPTGLMYPTTYSFVDCFKFLSIGTNIGSVQNDGGTTGNPTTGLASPITGFSSSYGIQTGTYIGWQGYEIGDGVSASACGTILTETGPRFFRAWSIPTGGSDAIVTENAGLAIQEFMVSPSSGSDPTGRYAFSRIVRPVTIPSGYRAIISYQLSVNIKNTGINQFFNGTFTTGNADVSEDQSLMQGWSNLSGYYRQVYHGLQCIDENGAHYVPKYGAGMEPYLKNLQQYLFYLSPDNAAFDVSSVTGGPQPSVNTAYQADGLMSTLLGIPMTRPENVPGDIASINNYYYGPVITHSDYPSNITPRNIRLGNSSTSLLTPSTHDYSVSATDLTNFDYQEFEDASTKMISYATPGLSGLNPTKANFTQKAVFSTRLQALPINMVGQNLPTGRKKTITRKTLFSPVSSLGYNTRFGSLVFGYANDATTSAPDRVIYPMVDTLFFDSSGRSLMQHYRLITPYMADRGHGVADSYICITPTGENTQRFNSRRTIQGIITGGSYTSTYTNITNQILNSGAWLDTSGQNPESTPFGGGAPYSGWGGVIGVQGGEYAFLPVDCGLINHTTGMTGKPLNSGTIYWPDSVHGSPLSIAVTGVLYYDPSWSYGTQPLSSGQLVTSGYSWTGNSFGFRPPIAILTHSDSISSSGHRLLPNHGIPNNQSIDVYPPLTGGSYPGLSFDNGLELYFDITWSSPCGTATNCNDPV